MLKIGLVTALFLVVIASFARAWSIGVERDKQAVTRLTNKLKTVCVGRFLIDVPDEAEIELRQARIDGFDIAPFSETAQDFLKRVADRELQIKAKPDYLGGSKNLEAVREVKTSSGLVGKIFIHSRTVEEGTQGNGLGGVERYRYEGITTEALVHGHGISIDLFFEDRDPDFIEDLHALVNQLVANPANHTPTEPGFCMDRVYVRDPLRAKQREQIMMFARLPRHPDVEFMFIDLRSRKPSQPSSATFQLSLALEGEHA
ncbi:hypothetical protein IM543_11870 [Massilia sp. UMI-21]|nr:hypothetical protein IM543_11870 [Massilia sp. UMI-21]